MVIACIAMLFQSDTTSARAVRAKAVRLVLLTAALGSLFLLNPQAEVNYAPHLAVVLREVPGLDSSHVLGHAHTSTAGKSRV